MNLGYRINSKYSHPLLFTLYFSFHKSISVPVNVCKIARRVANSVDPDQTPRSAASDLRLHCLLRLSFRICRVSTVI